MCTDPLKKATQVDILRELKRHGHPQSRVMENKRQRTTEEAAEELASHYEFVHNIKKQRLD